MRAKACDFGIFCILFFKGAYFDNPIESQYDMEFRLKKLASSKGIKNIFTLFIDLSKPLPPSEI